MFRYMCQYDQLQSYCVCWWFCRVSGYLFDCNLVPVSPKATSRPDIRTIHLSVQILVSDYKESCFCTFTNCDYCTHGYRVWEACGLVVKTDRVQCVCLRADISWAVISDVKPDSYVHVWVIVMISWCRSNI